MGRIFKSRDILLIQGTCTFQGLRSKNPLRHIKHYLSIVDNIQADGATRDASRLWNNQWKEERENGPEWVVRSKFEDELAVFMLEKKFHIKGIGEVLDQHRKGIHEQFSQIVSIIEKSKDLETEAPNFAITTRSGISTRDPPFLTPSRPTTTDHIEETTEKEGPEGEEPSIKQKKDDDDERLLSIFKQIHINLPFLEAMIHMPKGAKVLKDIISHKEKLKKASSSVKLSEECTIPLGKVVILLITTLEVVILKEIALFLLNIKQSFFLSCKPSRSETKFQTSVKEIDNVQLGIVNKAELKLFT
ncbi:hypothetical protein Tco_1446372 [Tanacetum coccineum]